MEYCSVKDVRDILKDDMLNVIIGNEYIEDENERELKIIPIIQMAIVDADAEIDGYLNKRYQTPIFPIPKIIVKLSKDIAVYNLVSRMGIEDGSREQTYKDRYDGAIKFLLEVSKGTIEIGVSTTEVKSGAKGYHIKSNERLFSRGTMKGW